MQDGYARTEDIHDSVIASIADQYQMNVGDVREIYEIELGKLQQSSRIKAFLPVLCSRHVREILLQTGRLGAA
jgi:hypothetical protein